MLTRTQTHSTSCPYFWGFCTDRTCDGCVADRGQGNPSATPPWAEGTTIEQRHELIQRAADAPDDTLARELVDDPWAWRRHILGV